MIKCAGDSGKNEESPEETLGKSTEGVPEENIWEVLEGNTGKEALENLRKEHLLEPAMQEATK